MDKQFSNILPDETKKILKDTFKALKENVLIEVFLKDEKDDQFSAFTSELIKEIVKLTDKIKANFYKIDSEFTSQKGITRAPTILIASDKYKIRYTGSPIGEEGQTIIMAIMLVSTGSTIFPETAIKQLLELKDRRHIQVFVSPTCPYCPRQALNAISAALIMPELIEAEIIEMYENRDYIDKYHIITVPFTVINDVPIGTGLKPPEIFAEEVLKLSSVEKIFAPISGDIIEADVAIIGGGPAGLTAGIYAGRSGLKSVIIEKATVGGQVLITPIVENYPGFTQIAGKTLVDIMYQQALQYSHILEGEQIISIEKTENIFILKTNVKTYKVKGLIIATGAEHKKLDVPGERSLYGRGVSYCATCDGYIFKDSAKVVVIGGGNTAVTDALYLHSIGANVSLVHRRNQLRAEVSLQKSLKEKGIPVYLDTEVNEIIGSKRVVGVRLQNLKDNSIKILEAEGVFIAIGYVPNNEVAKMIGIKMDEYGYIVTDNKQRTSMEMVYAAGDVTGGIKQIATAVGQGAIAAMSAFEDLSKPYWKNNSKGR